jgi:hypothetical protein
MKVEIKRSHHSYWNLYVDGALTMEDESFVVVALTKEALENPAEWLPDEVHEVADQINYRVKIQAKCEIEEIGLPGAESLRLLSTVTINNVSFHVEAVAVDLVSADDPDDVNLQSVWPKGGFKAVDPDQEDRLASLQVFSGGDGPMQTVAIEGYPHRYLIAILPFEE